MVAIPKSVKSWAVSLNERGSVDIAGLLVYSLSIVFPTGLRGRWKGGLGFEYRSTNALLGRSGSCCFVRGVDIDFNSLSKSEGKLFRAGLPYFSTGEKGRFRSAKSDIDTERPWEEGLCSWEERSWSSTSFVL